MDRMDISRPSPAMAAALSDYPPARSNPSALGNDSR
jgi:hypothetical protein